MISYGDFKGLLAKNSGSEEFFFIEPFGSRLLLDCSTDYRGNKLYPELPRSFMHVSAA